MTDTITKENLFRPVPPKPHTKAEITDSVSRAIIQAEVDAREAKTRRLRQARLERDALLASSAPAKARKTAKRFAARRAAKSTKQ